MDFKKKLIKENSERLDENYKVVIKKIRTELDKRKIRADVVLGGSAAKGTYLKDYDCDIFVQFCRNPDSDVLGLVLKKAFGEVDRLHGSRDYFRLRFMGRDYEIVPVLKISKAEQAENVTDVSMLHVAWVRKHLKNPGQAKLAKLFCKAQKIYGAESHICGFSGYILEILTVYYGSFDKLIEAAADWKPKVFIDVAKYYKNSKEILKEINASKLTSPLVVIDPVQKDRNAAAAVCMDKFTKFVKAANDYLRNPSEKFFIKKAFSKTQLEKEAKSMGSSLLALKAERLKGKEDVVCAKMLKVYEFIKKQLEHHDFIVLKSNFEFDEDTFWYIVCPKILPAEKKQQGPKKGVKSEFILQFRKKYRNAKLEKGRWVAVVRRKYRTANSLVEDLIKSEYVKERVAKLKWC